MSMMITLGITQAVPPHPLGQAVPHRPHRPHRRHGVRPQPIASDTSPTEKAKLIPASAVVQKMKRCRTMGRMKQRKRQNTK
eukprot:COSAG01_NODE_786_length_13606_cov_7.860517_3_plen_81_part_00